MGLADRVPAPAAAAGARAAARAAGRPRRAALAGVPRRALPRCRGGAARRALRAPDAGASRSTQRARALDRTTRERRSATLLSPGFLLGRPPAAGHRRASSCLDLDTYLPGDLLPKSDIASMAHSLELRSPLLDHRVVELGLSLPDHLKRAAARARSRCAARSPTTCRRASRDRGKSGFGVPLAAWFRGELRPLARELLLDEHARSRGWFRTEAVERLLDEHAAEPRRQRPPALDARDARAVAARARRRSRRAARPREPARRLQRRSRSSAPCRGSASSCTSATRSLGVEREKSDIFAQIVRRSTGRSASFRASRRRTRSRSTAGSSSRSTGSSDAPGCRSGSRRSCSRSSPPGSSTRSAAACSARAPGSSPRRSRR